MSIYKDLLKNITLSKNRCWIWTGYVDKRSGYGKYSRFDLVHRVSYNCFNDVRLTSDQELHHKCNNKLCINPVHLVLIDKSDHTKITDPGKYNRVKTKCINGHEFSKENTLLYKQSNKRSGYRRVCRICNKERSKINNESKYKF